MAGSPPVTSSSGTSWVSPSWVAARRNLGKGLALIGFSAVASSAAMAWIRSKALQADRSLPEEFVLELDMERLRVVEKLDTSPLAIIRGDAASQVRNRGQDTDRTPRLLQSSGGVQRHR